MLSPDELERLGNSVQATFDPITDYLIREIARRVSEAGQLTSTASYQVWKLQTLGVSQRQTKKKLRELLKVSHRELRRLLTQSAEVGYNYDIRYFPQVQALPFLENAAVQGILQTAIHSTLSTVDNLTGTSAMGFLDDKKVFHTLDDAFTQACDFAYSKVATGAQDYNSAIRDATRQLANRGIVTINYESGIKTELGAAVRRNVMGGLGMMQDEMSQQVHDDLGADGWEITAHDASAPDHEPYQGRQFSDKEYQDIQDHLVRDIGAYGSCGHRAHAIILGVSQPQYTAEQLNEMRRKNEEGVTIDGVHYTTYEATQKQRKFEGAIRKNKRRVSVADAAGSPDLPVHKSKLAVLNAEYRRFSKVAGLREQRERLWIPK